NGSSDAGASSSSDTTGGRSGSAASSCPPAAGTGTTCTLCENTWHCPNEQPDAGVLVYPPCPESVANGSSLDTPCGNASDCVACQDPDMFYVANAAWLWTCDGTGWQGST